MKKLIKGTAMAAFLTIALAGSQLWAQVSGESVNVTINVEIQEYLWLWFESSNINFPWTTPETEPEWIEAEGNPYDILALAFVPSTQDVRLQARATGDLVSGSDTITVDDHIRWTGTDDFAGGSWPLTTLDADIVTWTGFGLYTGTFSFQYYNDPQAPGNYETELVFTLASP
ncbi:MAG: hypothetical protein ACOC57_02595 [Acidobacteriota bacterium]